MNTTERKQMRVELERNNAVDTLISAAELLERRARELRQAAEDVKADRPNYNAESILNNAINNISSNIIGCCRLDLMATYSTRLAIAKAALETEQEG